MEIEEALSILKNALKPIKETEVCPLTEAFGRIAAGDLFAPINVPPFAKSAMDGYAVRAADLEGASEKTPVQLKVTGELFAGDWKDFHYCKNSAIRVMTGSPVPEGFDAVVMQEATDCGEETVRIFKPVRPWQNYCSVGEDIKKNSLILSRGTKLDRTKIALLAGLGISQVEVLRQLRVSILCTGSELIPAGKPLLPGKIYSSIGIMLSHSVKNAGFITADEKIIPDDEKQIKKAMEDALKVSDLIITTGGISVGKKDLLPDVLSELGAKKLFSHVNIQPGTPTSLSLLQDKLIISLSGNPYAAAVNFDIYFYHAAACLMDSPPLAPKEFDALLMNDYEKTSNRRRFLRAYLENGKVFLPAKNHASSVISNITECNCYVDAAAEQKLEKGDKVHIMMMGV